MPKGIGYSRRGRRFKSRRGRRFKSRRRRTSKGTSRSSYTLIPRGGYRM